MKDRGFTLIELLAVIVIITLLALIAIPNIVDLVNTSKDKAYDRQVEMIEDAARRYAVDNNLNIEDNQKICINSLIEGGYLSSKKIKNPKDNTNMNGCVIVSINGEKYNYSYREDGTEIVRAAGIDFPVTDSGDGLYYDENTGEYYFKGASPNNYIEFSGSVWRIMSINSTGNLKIIKEDRIDLTGYSGVNTSNSLKGRFDASGKSGRRTSGYCSKDSAVTGGCNAWGTMNSFVNGSIRGAVTGDAELNTYLNTTYKSSLTDISYVQTNMIWNVGSAGSYNDTNSINQLQSMESTYTWTGDIALATKSEYIRAHGNSLCSNAKYVRENDTCKTTNYLFKSEYIYWLLSPISATADYLFATFKGYTGNDFASDKNTSSVLPVLYLKSNITLTGNGGHSSGDMYKIVS